MKSVLTIIKEQRDSGRNVFKSDEQLGLTLRVRCVPGNPKAQLVSVNKIGNKYTLEELVSEGETPRTFVLTADNEEFFSYVGNYNEKPVPDAKLENGVFSIGENTIDTGDLVIEQILGTLPGYVVVSVGNFIYSYNVQEDRFNPIAGGVPNGDTMYAEFDSLTVGEDTVVVSRVYEMTSYFDKELKDDIPVERLLNQSVKKIIMDMGNISFVDVYPVSGLISGVSGTVKDIRPVVGSESTYLVTVINNTEDVEGVKNVVNANTEEKTLLFDESGCSDHNPDYRDLGSGKIYEAGSQDSLVTVLKRNEVDIVGIVSLPLKDAYKKMKGYIFALPEVKDTDSKGNKTFTYAFANEKAEIKKVVLTITDRSRTIKLI